VGEIPPAVTLNLATPGYFAAVGIRLMAGRGFEAGDVASEAHPIIVSAALARTLFRGQDAIGQRVRLAERPLTPWYTIVGLVDDVPGETIAGGSASTAYFPVLDDLRDDPGVKVAIPLVPREMTVVVRTSVPPMSLVGSVRRIVRAIDSTVPISRIRTLEQVVTAATARIRLTTLLLLVAAGAALFLGVVGIYGVVSYTVGQRASEFGVRLALGASPTDIRQMVLRQGALVALAGIGAGLMTALVLTRFLRGLLFEVSPSEPLAFAAMAALLFAVAVVASYVPAHRAGQEE